MIRHKLDSKDFDQSFSLIWSKFLAILLIASFAYALMEWLFFVTKPSFMSVMSLREKWAILLFTGSLITAIGFLITLPLFLLSGLPWFLSFRSWLVKMASLLPAIITASLLLLWLDNFTYTLFKFGIVSTRGIARGAYAALFIALVAVSFRRILHFIEHPSPLMSHFQFRIIPVILVFGTLLFTGLIIWLNSETRSDKVVMSRGGNQQDFPHILLITGDGLLADHMSVYGYERDTTPNLRRLAEAALVAENAFPNTAHTSGSVVSIYTSKEATFTRVLFIPDILRGKDAYQHLPGILRMNGYRTVQISDAVYADAYTLNVLEGFDLANGRSLFQSMLFQLLRKYLPDDFAYFVYETGNRLADRLRHIFYIQTMINPYQVVTKPTAPEADQQRLESLLEQVLQSNSPLFVHVHFLGTHGPVFFPSERVFSSSQSQDQPWDLDAYDDSILEFDHYIGVLLDHLRKGNLLDKSVLIIGTDHGPKSSITQRIPLLIRFPNGQFAGRIEVGVQNLDIAPTLLDYLNLEIPNWMKGQSLLTDSLPQRSIFSALVAYAEETEPGIWKINQGKIKPPFYQFWKLSLIYCQRWYLIDLIHAEWSSGEIDGYIHPCSDEMLLSDQQARQILLKHLQDSGFDTSALVEHFEQNP